MLKSSVEEWRISTFWQCHSVSRILYVRRDVRGLYQVYKERLKWKNCNINLPVGFESRGSASAIQPVSDVALEHLEHLGVSVAADMENPAGSEAH